MTSYVKPSRLHVCLWALLSYLVLAPLAAFAITPTDAARLPWRIDQNGNSFIFTTVDGKNVSKNPLFTAAGVAHNTPILEAETKLPFPNNAGSDAKLKLKWPVDPKKVSDAAAKAAKSAAAGASTGNGYLFLASVACAFVCDPLKQALTDWGVDQLSVGSDGSLAVSFPDPDVKTEVSKGLIYSHNPSFQPYSITLSEACDKFRAWHVAQPPGPYGLYDRSYLLGSDCYFHSTQYNITSGPRQLYSRYDDYACPAGSLIVAGVCGGAPPTVDLPLGEYIQSNYTGKGWGRHWADMTAGLVAAGENVFTDGTGTTITGPAVIPVSVNETKTLINVVPGTTTPVSPGHTGATDPATKVTTTTQVVKPVYNPGSSTTGPSVTANTQTTTETKVVNNATKVESSPVVESVTDTDAPPKVEEKSDHCEKNADTLGCLEVDVPEGEIPETTIELDYEYESLFGNGSCPASDAVSFAGQQVHVVDMPALCDMVQSWVQPFVIASAFLVAMMIFAGGIRS